MLTFAIPKGSLLADSIRLLQTIGLDFSAFLDESNRLLQITDPQGRAKAMLVRAQDVPVYVEYGEAQLGIAGEDVLREKMPKVARLLDLQFGHCRMSIAVPQSSPYRSGLSLPPHSRIASKSVRITQEYFASIDLPVEIIPLYGSVELAPITGMADAIVDLVSTGRTLRENGLLEIEVLFHSTARLIAHTLSYRLDRENISTYVEKIREVISS